MAALSLHKVHFLLSKHFNDHLIISSHCYFDGIMFTHIIKYTKFHYKNENTSDNGRGTQLTKPSNQSGKVVCMCFVTA